MQTKPCDWLAQNMGLSNSKQLSKHLRKITDEIIIHSSEDATRELVKETLKMCQALEQP